MLLLTNGSALAQAQEEATEEIVVVGSRGEARDPMESAVPVDVISADEIAAAHSFGGELGELLQALAPSFSFPRQSNSGAGDHVRAAQLRGMSPDHTLVLVNGKRQHTASVVALESAIGLGTNPFDFNTIPLIAIERVEILRDGAGAQYGSDAIAGVINIVLKDAAQGGTVTASYGQHRTDFEPTGGNIDDGDTFSVAADYGFEVGDGGSLRIGGEYRTRDATNRAGIGVLPFFEDDTPANQALNPARVFVGPMTSMSFTMRLFRSARGNFIRSAVIPIVRPRARDSSVIRTDFRACPASTRTDFGR
jgi:iron complex outermembrane receptor protein